MAVGRIIGPSFAADEVPGVVERLIEVYVRERREGERFVDTVARLGSEPFRRGVYGQRAGKRDAALAEAA